VSFPAGAVDEPLGGTARDGRLSTPNRRGGASGSGARDEARAPVNGDSATEAGGHERAPDRFALGGGHRRERRADVRGRDTTEQHQRLLHPVVHVDERRRVEDANERLEPLVDATRAVEVALLAGGEQLRLEV